MKRHIEQLEAAIKQNEQTLANMKALLADLKKSETADMHPSRDKAQPESEQGAQKRTGI